MAIEYTEEKRFTVEQVEALFKSVGWESAQWPERLFKALQHSDTVISAWDGGHLVGLVRVLDDTEMVAYMHWVLVDPAYHGQHIGSHLVELVKAKYRDYFLLEVMPEESKNAPFYQKHGFHLMDDGRAMRQSWATYVVVDGYPVAMFTIRPLVHTVKITADVRRCCAMTRDHE